MSKRRPLHLSEWMGGRRIGEILNTRNGNVEVRPCTGDHVRTVEYTCKYGTEPLNGAWLAFAKDLRDGIFDGCSIEAVSPHYGEGSDSVRLYVYYQAGSDGGPTWGQEPSPWTRRD